MVNKKQPRYYYKQAYPWQTSPIEWCVYGGEDDVSIATVYDEKDAVNICRALNSTIPQVPDKAPYSP